MNLYCGFQVPSHKTVETYCAPVFGGWVIRICLPSRAPRSWRSSISGQKFRLYLNVVSTPSSVPKVLSSLSHNTTAKRSKRNLATADLHFMQECQRTLTSSTAEPTEYEAVGINVTKNTQAIDAETLINFVLQKGLLKELPINTNICDNATLKTTSNANSLSNGKGSVDETFNKDTSQVTNILQYYKDSASFFDL